jgi:hypothetical protein
MTRPGETTEHALLQHAERQTKALENISSAVMLLLALAILGVLVGAAALWG